jgi:hypothetical protein
VLRRAADLLEVRVDEVWSFPIAIPAWKIAPALARGIRAAAHWSPVVHSATLPLY